MKLNFFKMHAQGNDYIYFDFMSSAVPDLNFSTIAVKLSDRNYGIGSDGLVLIQHDDECDAFMRIFNADGSEAEMCGSALRCTAHYLSKKSKIKTNTINTQSGKKSIFIEEDDTVKVSLGKAELLSDKPIEINDIKGYPVCIGNQHFVCFTKILNPQTTHRFGPMIENNEAFPDKTNVDFVQIVQSSPGKDA